MRTAPCSTLLHTPHSHYQHRIESAPSIAELFGRVALSFDLSLNLTDMFQLTSPFFVAPPNPNTPDGAAAAAAAAARAAVSACVRACVCMRVYACADVCVLLSSTVVVVQLNHHHRQSTTFTHHLVESWR